jgi:hypothetical protein
VPTPASRRRPPFGFYLAALCAGAAGGLLLAEITARLAGLHPVGSARKYWLLENARREHYYHCYPTNPNGEFQPLPDTNIGYWTLLHDAPTPRFIPFTNIRSTPWCVEYRCTRTMFVEASNPDGTPQGFRDRHYPATPPTGVLRIAGLGDSFAAGMGVPEQKTVFALLRKQLGARYEIVNCAMPGLDTTNELLVLGYVKTDLNCQRALVIWIPNDVETTPQLRAREKLINDLINVRHEQATPPLLLFDLLQSAWAERQVGKETERWYLDAYGPENKANVEKLRGQLRTLASDPRCPAALVLFPLMDDFEGGYPLQPIHEQVLAMAREAGLPTLDLTPAFRAAKVPTESLWVHPIDHHPNGRAHAIAAGAIGPWLRTLPGFLQHSR